MKYLIRNIELFEACFSTKKYIVLILFKHAGYKLIKKKTLFLSNEMLLIGSSKFIVVQNELPISLGTALVYNN